ncbi:uncharacterized protein BDR25DRAFT_263030, partial [Lindgomyces ingoldianus]
PLGRPRKFPTTAVAADARKKRDQQRYLRQRHPQGLADFIAYEPQIPADVPTETPTEISLRTTVQVPISQE